MSEEEDFENVRRRFKKEALQACQEAEQRGYEAGYEKCATDIGKLQDELRKWKEICRATSVDLDSEKSSKTAPLIKYIMEMVYRDIKSCLSESETEVSTDAIRVIKDALLVSTQALQKKLPRLVLVRDETAVLQHPNMHLRDNKGSGLSELAKGDKETKSPSPKVFCSAASVVKRPSNLTVTGVLHTNAPFKVKEQRGGSTNTAQYPKYDFEVSVHAGYLVEASNSWDKEFITYDIHSKLMQVSKQAQASSESQSPAHLTTCRIYKGFSDHRFSHFEALYSTLKKDFPLDVFPYLKLSNAPHTGSNKHAISMRSRQLSLWMKCICTHRLLLAAPAVIQFLSKEWHNQRSAAPVLFSTMSGGGESHALPLPAQGRRDLDTPQSSTLIYEGVDPEEAATEADEKEERISASRLSSSLAHAPTATMAAPMVKSAVHSYTYTDIVRHWAYRQLHTIERDLRQLEPQYLDTIDCGKVLISAKQKLRGATADFHTSIFDTYPQSSLLLFMPLRGAASQEEAETPEFSTQGMNLSAVTANACIERESDILTEYFIEPVTYMQCNYMPQMKQSIAATCAFPIGSDERVEAIDKTSLEWNSFRDARQRVGLEYILNGAKLLREEHRHQQEQWLQMAAELKKLEFDEIPMFAAFKDKKAVGSKVKAHRGDCHTGNPGQSMTPDDAFVRCLLWRPVVPASARRRPTVQQHTLQGDLSEAISGPRKVEGQSVESCAEKVDVRDSEYVYTPRTRSRDGDTDGYWVEGGHGEVTHDTVDECVENAECSFTDEDYFQSGGNDVSANNKNNEVAKSTDQLIRKKKKGFFSKLFSTSSKAQKEKVGSNVGKLSKDKEEGGEVRKSVHCVEEDSVLGVSSNTSVKEKEPTSQAIGGNERASMDCSPINTPLSRAYEKQQEKLHAARKAQQEQDIQEELDRQVGAHASVHGPAKRPAVIAHQSGASAAGGGSTAGVRRMKTQSVKVSTPVVAPVPPTGTQSVKVSNPVPIAGQGHKAAVASGVKEDGYSHVAVSVPNEAASPAVKPTPNPSHHRKQSKASYSWGASAAEAPVSYHTRDHSSVSTGSFKASSPIAQKVESSAASGNAASTDVLSSDSLPTVEACVSSGGEVDASRSSAEDRGWEKVVPTDGGRAYYYHRTTRVSRWDKPEDHVTEVMEERLEQNKRAEEAAVARRKEELVRKRMQEDETAALTEKYEANIKAAVLKWSQQSHFGGSCLGQLLGTLHVILPSLFPEPLSVSLANSPDGAAVDTGITKMSTAPGIKKGYVKAVRLVHPDKLAVGIDLHTKLLAEEVFIVLSQQYDQYRKSL